MARFTTSIATIVVALIATFSVSNAFVPSSQISAQSRTFSTPTVTTQKTTFSAQSTTALNERRWNFNEARGPFGMKKNAEIWNGRVAQMGFVFVLLQELITGKGVIAGLQDGDIFSYICLGLTGVTVVGLTAFLAIKGKENDIVY
eukprot:CAMPEP_0178961694 /NCGR_PEP_ID=MMETSP0789-20121207/13878_1 /TAXON_ID=3005 /ORGANISM="Rhizosolenia setigera, Strain CCMP 1694" /LENGTH=144 /DNA_ID=CAMNT_0020645615 /DNA_START=116 /DNA_END=550 /DNA_ORIENTATION=+